MGATPGLDTLHHVALHVDDIDAAVQWYTTTFVCEVAYQDSTWAMLTFANTQLALVSGGQHPPHIAIARDDAERYGTLTTHRDGTRSTYVRDPFGNEVELLKLP